MKTINKLIIIAFLAYPGLTVCGNKQIRQTNKEPKKLELRKSPRIYNLNQVLRYKEYKRK